MNRLIIEETSVYELDEECVREKERERKNSQESMGLLPESAHTSLLPTKCQIRPAQTPGKLQFFSPAGRKPDFPR